MNPLGRVLLECQSIIQIFSAVAKNFSSSTLKMEIILKAVHATRVDRKRQFHQ